MGNPLLGESIGSIFVFGWQIHVIIYECTVWGTVSPYPPWVFLWSFSGRVLFWWMFERVNKSRARPMDAFHRVPWFFPWMTGWAGCHLWWLERKFCWLVGRGTRVPWPGKLYELNSQTPMCWMVDTMRGRPLDLLHKAFKKLYRGTKTQAVASFGSLWSLLLKLVKMTYWLLVYFQIFLMNVIDLGDLQ